MSCFPSHRLLLPLLPKHPGKLPLILQNKLKKQNIGLASTIAGWIRLESDLTLASVRSAPEHYGAECPVTLLDHTGQQSNFEHQQPKQHPNPAEVEGATPPELSTTSRVRFFRETRVECRLIILS